MMNQVGGQNIHEERVKGPPVVPTYSFLTDAQLSNKDATFQKGV